MRVLAISLAIVLVSSVAINSTMWHANIAEGQNQDLTSLSDAELVTKFQNELTTLDQIGNVTEEAIVYDLASKSTSDLRNKVNSYVTNSELKPKLLKIMDSAKTILGNTQLFIDSLDEEGANSMLSATIDVLQGFISKVEKEKPKKVSDAIAFELIGDANAIITDLNDRGIQILPIQDNAALPSFSGLVEKAKTARQDLINSITEMKRRGYVFEVKVVETEIQIPAAASSEGGPSLAAQSQSTGTFLALHIIIDSIPTFNNKVVGVVKAGMSATLTGLEVQEELARRGEPSLTLSEVARLHLLNIAIFNAVEFAIDKTTNVKASDIRVLSSVGKAIASALTSSSAAQMLAEIFSGITAAVVLGDVVEIGQREADLVLFLRRVFNNLISGFVLEDRLGNGLQDPRDFAEDVSSPGWSVQLIPGDGSPMQLRITGNDGFFQFADLPNGSYNVRIELQAGWVNTTPIVKVAELNGLAASIGTNFGVFETIVVSGRVINDLDGDGNISEGESGLPSWKVDLVNEGTGETFSQVTDASGHYSFTGVSYGSHQLLQDVAGNPGFTQTYPVDETGNPIAYLFSPFSGTDRSGNDFGSKLSGPPPQTGPNVVGNPGFESGSLAVYAAEPRGSWGSTGTQLGGQVSVTSEDKHSGTNSLKIMTTSDDQSAYVYQYFTVGTTTYSYSFWFKGTAGLGTAEVINGWGPPSPLVGGPYNPQVGALMALGTASFPLDGQWHRATAVNTPTTQALYLDGAQISCGAGNTNMPDVTIIGDLTQAAHSITVYIDDVSVVSGQEYQFSCP